MLSSTAFDGIHETVAHAVKAAGLTRVGLWFLRYRTNKLAASGA